MTRPIYLGDTSLSSAAAYLAGLMSHWGWEFDYLPSDQPLTMPHVKPPRPLYILSDYPAERVDRLLQERIVQQVEAGAGLVMIGGWESYVGSAGNWNGTPIGNILPVAMGASDDRFNCDHLLVVRQVASHPAIDGLPWNERPPIVGGLNRVKPRAGAEVLLEARRFRLRWEARGGDRDPALAASLATRYKRDEAFAIEPLGAEPLLVVGRYGKGKVVALTTDVAPHWVGPLIDWGDERVSAQVVGGDSIEVGSLYAKWLKQLLEWTRGS
jgi:hypothetical protein